MKAFTPLRLLILPAAILAVTPACKNNSEARNDAQWWRLEGDRVELAHDVDLLKLKLGNACAIKNQLAEAKAVVERNSDRLAELKADAGDLRGEVAYLASKTEQERDNWIRGTRAAAMGKEFGTLVGKNGRTYENVTITKITDIGIEFRHSNGSARLTAADLSVQQHAAFCLDPEVAFAALAQEKENAQIYEDWIGERIVVANEAKQAADDAAAARETERTLVAARARSEALQENFSAAAQTTSRLRQEPRSFGNSYWGGYSRTTYYYPDYVRSCYYPSYSSCTPRYRCAYGVGSYSNNRGGQGYTRQVRPLNFSQPRFTRPAVSVP